VGLHESKIFGRLLSNDLDDPLGFLVAGYLARDTTLGGRLNLQVRFREETVLNRLFRYLQLGSLYPESWASFPAQRMQKLADLIETCDSDGWLPVWQRQEKEESQLPDSLYSGALPTCHVAGKDVDVHETVDSSGVERGRWLDDAVADGLD